jgi:hypothetical protein
LHLLDARKNEKRKFSKKRLLIIIAVLLPGLFVCGLGIAIVTPLRRPSLRFILFFFLKHGLDNYIDTPMLTG